MGNISKFVEEMAWIDEDFFIEWRDEIAEYFYPAALDDIGRLDWSAYNYLISLNKNNESLSSEEVDSLLERDDAYFMEIIISREKMLASVHFWQYPKGGQGGILNVSEKAFLSEQEAMKNKFIDFAKENRLVILNDKDLKELVPYQGEMVTIYFKYFDDQYESSREIPY